MLGVGRGLHKGTEWPAQQQQFRFQFLGLLAFYDPPKAHIRETLQTFSRAGIEVKMITGDHLNIAKETARLIGMGQNIHPGEATRDATEERNELIKSAHGFAQVLPKDKREEL